MSELLAELEARVNALTGRGPTTVARLLGVPYTSTYSRWKRGEQPLAAYHTASVRAMLRLSDRELRKMVAEA